MRNNCGTSECHSIACACPLGPLLLNDDWGVLETLGRQGPQSDALIGKLRRVIAMTLPASTAPPQGCARATPAADLGGHRGASA